MLERLEAEKRQKNKIEAKKAQAEAVRKSSEERAKLLLQEAQTIRSSVFAAAREGNAAKVKKGIWEDAVDAAGGEVKNGSVEFVKDHPVDTKETLLHIASASGDFELVKWLDSHGTYMIISINKPLQYMNSILRRRSRRKELAGFDRIPRCFKARPHFDRGALP